MSSSVQETPIRIEEHHAQSSTDRRRDALGTFAPQFAALNDYAAVRRGVVQRRPHPKYALHPHRDHAPSPRNGATTSFDAPRGQRQEERRFGPRMAAILTHVAFYAGWPNAWAAFRWLLKVCTPTTAWISKYPHESHRRHLRTGRPQHAYAAVLHGPVLLELRCTDPAQTQFIANVTFEPGCRNNWHIHHATEGGGQFLLVTDGEGWYRSGASPPQDRQGDCGVHPGQREALARRRRR